MDLLNFIFSLFCLPIFRNVTSYIIFLNAKKSTQHLDAIPKDVFVGDWINNKQIFSHQFPSSAFGILLLLLLLLFWAYNTDLQHGCIHTDWLCCSGWVGWDMLYIRNLICTRVTHCYSFLRIWSPSSSSGWVGALEDMQPFIVLWWCYYYDFIKLPISDMRLH